MSVRTVFKRILGNSYKDTGQLSKGHVDEIQEYQPFNPFTELLFLEQHQDIVRILVKIDSKSHITYLKCTADMDQPGQPHCIFDDCLKSLSTIQNLIMSHTYTVSDDGERKFIPGIWCITAGDDNLAIVWDIQFGFRQVTLTGHSRPITSILCLPPSRDHYQEVITGSSDKQIRLWNVDTGDCIKVITEHQTFVQTLLLCPVSTCYFYSAGEDICLWSKDGQLITSYKQAQDTDENINFMILLKDNRIVTAADKNLDLFTVTFSEGQGQINSIKKLSPHREAVKSLINVSDGLFASGSLDGTVILWKTDSLLPYCYFNSEADYMGLDKTFPYSIEHMICLERRYIVTSVGSGFLIYDALKQKTLLKKENAHHSKITYLSFVCNGIYLLTAAVDGSIRIWSFIEMLQDIIQNDTINSFGLAHRSSDHGVYEMWWNMEKYQHSLSLIGECLAHAGPVQALLDCDGESFVSCGVDGLVIVWKNENIQMLKRSHVLQSLSHVCGGIV